MKIGLVGFGKMGKIREHVISNFPGAHLVGIYDNKNYNEIPKKYKRCKSFNELLSLKIDTIFIATYVNYLSEYTIKALAAGLNVL